MTDTVTDSPNDPSTQGTSSESDDESGGWLLSLVLSAVILGGAIGAAVLTFMTEPTAERAEASKETAMLVDVTDVEKGDFRPQIVAQGTVEPARDVMLRPQVSGRVVDVADNFTPGGHVDEGDQLLRIEAADFRHELAQRKSDLQEAKSNLTLEKGRRQASEAEYDRYGEDLPPENEALVLREPQLETAKQRVESARAAVEQAKLDLSRTRVEAPFDARVVRRMANLGSQISPNEDIARLVGIDRYWVGIELPLSKLRWVTVGDEDDSSNVEIRNPEAWGGDVSRVGRLHKKVGVLDEDSRMARVLAEIPDPLAIEHEGPELTIGEFVDATIEGNELEDVVRLDRKYVRQDDTVWLMEDGELQVESLDVVVRDRDYVYVDEGIEGDSRVVTTQLSTVRDGAPLRLSAEEEGSSADRQEGDEGGDDE